MFRLWGKVFHDNHLLKDIVIENNNKAQTRTAKVFAAVDEICQTFDFSHPLWLDSNIAEFKRHAKTRFTQDNFVDSVEFDFLEVHVIEED